MELVQAWCTTMEMLMLHTLIWMSPLGFFFLVFMTAMELETWELLFRNLFFFFKMDELNARESKGEKVL